MERRGTILIAEKDPSMMTLVCDVLSMEGLSVARYASAISALDGILSRSADVLVFEADASCRSPFEVMRDVSMLADEPGAPVIVVWTRSNLGSMWSELENVCEQSIHDIVDPGGLATSIRQMTGPIISARVATA